MNKNYTLKELADIGVKAANSTPDGSTYIENAQAFTKAVLDAIGYEFPKDEEREAFERWQKSHTVDPNDAFFDVWRAGREELRRSINKPTYSMPNNYAGIAFLASQQVDLTTEQQKAVDACLKEELSLAEPAWIPWGGGECPLADGVKRWECKFRGGWTSEFDYIVRGVWHHGGHINDIVAYRVIQ